MKSEKQKCLAGELFNTSDDELQELISKARKLTAEYNSSSHDASEIRSSILSRLFNKIGTNVNIDTPFYCDYGKHISIGRNVIINMNCIFVDCNKISIGDNVLIASNVQLCTATHPVNPIERLVENWSTDSKIPYFRTFALPIIVENNVWVGAGAIILPGVTIGENSVIGAGSIVNKPIPKNSVAVGNPCKVIKNVND